MNIAASRPRLNLLITILVVVVLALFPIIGVPPNIILYIFLFYIYLSMSNMWNLLAGYSGLVSLCPAAFIGLSGYTLAILTWFGWPWYIGLILGGIVAAIFAIIISYPVFRLKGIYFSIGTLILPEILRYIFIMWKPVGAAIYGGGAGYTVKGVTDITQAQFYWLAMTVALISFIVMQFVLRSKLGMGLSAIRDNDNTAASCGINVYRLKTSSFAISAFVTGIAGAIFFIYSGYIEPVSGFGIQWLVTIMLATVIGGISTSVGPIIGTIVVVFLQFLLARYAGISLVIQGVILIGIMLLAPQGIVGTVQGTRVFRSLIHLTAKH